MFLIFNIVVEDYCVLVGSGDYFFVVVFEAATDEGLVEAGGDKRAGGGGHGPCLVMAVDHVGHGLTERVG